MRKLASIQKILALEPIEGADRIVAANILGWWCVVQKDLYKVGDLCVYFEIDSVLPISQFPELESCKGRIRTRKFKKQVSQGYCVPIDSIQCTGFNLLPEGEDVTELLGVVKYEPPEDSEGGFMLGNSAGNFPSHLLPKTDEERLQSNLWFLDRMKGNPYVITLKCDGSSFTCGLDDGEYFVASRNLKKKDGDFFHVADKYKFKENILVQFPQLIFQGELCGPGIQKNRLGLSEKDLFIFRIYNQETKQFLLFDEREAVCQMVGLRHVPFIERGEEFNHDLDSLLELSEGVYEGTNNQREGIVIELDGYDFKYNGGRFSFKVISQTFLLKGGD